jgi:hypothetical protein
MIKIKVSFNKNKILAEAARESEQGMRKLAPVVERELREATPKDTGAAAADWDVLKSGPKGEFTVTNEKEYVKYLNAGSSRQAPSMFIERTVLKHGNAEGVVVEYKDEFL